MTQFGYTAMGEQTPARQLITDLVAAEAVGFDFSVMSDHYFPWLEEQGHSPNAWAVLGAAAQVTERLPLMTFVTCPTFRYHPAVVAQQAATVGVLSRGRFTLGLGAGENLNEHITGAGWPTARVRHERLEEAVEIIRQLFAGEYVSYQGRHFQVERAKLYDLPDQAPPVGIAVSGPDSIRLAADHADVMITVEPDGDLVRRFGEQGGAGKPVYGQLAVCYDRDEKAARQRARELWRWALPGWHVMAELPDPRAFDAASQHVTEDDIAALVPCGPDTGQYVKAVREYVQAGFTHVALSRSARNASTTSSTGAPVSYSRRYASSEEPARPWLYRPARVAGTHDWNHDRNSDHLRRRGSGAGDLARPGRPGSPAAGREERGRAADARAGPRRRACRRRPKRHTASRR